MHPHQRYREQIDASRPGSADLQLPELTELAKALASDTQLAQQLDRAHENDIALHQALHAVDQPSGLNDRLLSQLFAPAAQTLGIDRPVVDQPRVDQHQSLPQAAAATVASAPAAVRWSRRKWLVLALATAAVALVAVSATVWNQNQPREQSKELLTANVVRWLEQTRSRDWKSDGAAATLADFPIDSAVRANPLRWRSLTTSTRDRGVIYDLTPAGQQQAVLFVVHTNDHFAVGGTPHTKIQASGGRRIVAWQTGKLLYVLAVDESDGQRLESFLNVRPLTIIFFRSPTIAWI